MGIISSDTLFHFMLEFEYLKQALEGKLYPRYYKESVLPFFKEPRYIGMKSFCDIPLSLIYKHAKMYGEYSIGLKKEWGVKKCINPVTYYCQNSDYVKALSNAYNASIAQFNAKSGNDDPEINAHIEIVSSLRRAFLNYKPYKGRMWRNGKWIKSRVFYDEREWRYITKIHTQSTSNGFLQQSFVEKDLEYHDLTSYNMMLANNDGIVFSPDDVNFIIVRKKPEIVEVCGIIDNMEISDDEKCLLKTRIIVYSDVARNM